MQVKDGSYLRVCLGFVSGVTRIRACAGKILGEFPDFLIAQPHPQLAYSCGRQQVSVVHHLRNRILAPDPAFSECGEIVVVNLTRCPRKLRDCLLQLQ